AAGSGETGRLTAATMARAMSALPCRLWAAAGDCADSTIRMRLRTSGMYFSMRVRVCSSPARRVMPTCRMRSLSALCRVTVKASSGMKMGAGTAAGAAGGATNTASAGPEPGWPTPSLTGAAGCEYWRCMTNQVMATLAAATMASASSQKRPRRIGLPPAARSGRLLRSGMEGFLEVAIRVSILGNEGILPQSPRAFAGEKQHEIRVSQPIARRPPGSGESVHQPVGGARRPARDMHGHFRVGRGLAVPALGLAARLLLHVGAGLRAVVAHAGLAQRQAGLGQRLLQLRQRGFDRMAHGRVGRYEAGAR